MIFTRVVGTPRFRDACRLPPTPGIQFPNRVRSNTQVAIDGKHKPPDDRNRKVGSEEFDFAREDRVCGFIPRKRLEPANLGSSRDLSGDTNGRAADHEEHRQRHDERRQTGLDDDDCR